jgi:hypothetical protein
MQLLDVLFDSTTDHEANLHFVRLSQGSFEIIIATLQLQRCTIAAALAVVMRGSAAISRSARAVEMQRDAVEQSNMK